MIEASAAVTEVEYGPLGETAATSPTVIWLAGGYGSDTRYFTLTVNPVTGLTDLKYRATEGLDADASEPP